MKTLKLEEKQNQSLVKDFFNRKPNFRSRDHLILDHRMAHRWFELLKLGADEDIYTFQEVIKGKSGPKVNIRDQPVYMMSSYDYLGLIGHPEIESASIDAIHEYGTGTGGVRLLTGTNVLHHHLEKSLSRFLGTESSMVLSSGYMANLAVIAGLFSKSDLVIADERIHRSIVDALKVAGIQQEHFRHNDPLSLKSILEKTERVKRKLILVEGVYSMDGDLCPLPEILALKEAHHAFLMIDEAHSLGVLGKTGRGITEHFGISPGRVDLFTGSLSKAIPANGGFVSAKEEVILYLKHGGAPYMFSAALSPANSAAALKSLEIIDKEPWRLNKLWQNTNRMMEGLRKGGIVTGSTQSPIIPVLCGKNEDAAKLSKGLLDRGFLATAVIYPAVPINSAILRLCSTASQSPDRIDQFAEALEELYTTVIRQS